MTERATGKLSKSLASKPVNGPITHKVITTHNKPAVIIPKPFVDYYGITSDFSEFEISLVERGLLLTLKPRKEIF